METDLLAEKMKQGAEILEKLTAMGATGVTVKSTNETLSINVSGTGPSANTQDGQESITATISDKIITFTMPKPKKEKAYWENICVTLFVFAFVGFLFYVAILIWKCPK